MTKTKRLRLAITELQFAALEGVLDRGYFDAWDYLLSVHAKLDYGDQYPVICRQNASQFRELVTLLYSLGWPEQSRRDWLDLAERLEKLADLAEREAANVNS